MRTVVPKRLLDNRKDYDPEIYKKTKKTEDDIMWDLWRMA